MDGILLAKRKEVSIKETGTTVYVPQNATSKLLYYLSCVNYIVKLVELDIDDVDYSFVRMVINYQHCQPWTKTNQEKQRILRVARKLSPSIMEDKIFFRATDLSGSKNRFFEIDSSEITVAATDEIVIGGLSKRIHEVMLYESSWLQDNYYDAIRDLDRELQQPTRESYYALG
jgi:hypothetical protein